MCHLTWFLKRFQLEAYFVPVDPGVMAIAATVYAGPVMMLFCNTATVQVFHFVWSWGLPAAREMEAIENIFGLSTGLTNLSHQICQGRWAGRPCLERCLSRIRLRTENSSPHVHVRFISWYDTMILAFQCSKYEEKTTSQLHVQPGVVQWPKAAMSLHVVGCQSEKWRRLRRRLALQFIWQEPSL